MQVTLFNKGDEGILSSIEWVDLMKRIRDGYWRDIVERSRKEAIGRDELKKRLPAFGTSVTFTGGDEAANVVKYNHIVSIDFNKVLASPDNSYEKIAQCREMCRDIPSVVGFYITKSGRGFRIFVLVNTGIDEHKIIYHPLQEHFERLFGLQADDKYKDITRLSFVSFDPDCFYRRIESAEAFPIETIIPFRRKTADSSKINELIEDVQKFLRGKYEIRYNVLIKKLQIRLKSDSVNVVPSAMVWSDINDNINNNLVTNINDNGVRITYNQFKWMIENGYIASDYNPAKDFDLLLPEWDGVDYIKEVSLRLNADSKDTFSEFLESWLVGMYQSWMNPRTVRKDVLVLLSSERGAGCAAWASSLLPEQLRQYSFAGYLKYAAKNLNSILSTSLLTIVEDADNEQMECLKAVKNVNAVSSIIITSDSDKYVRTITPFMKPAIFTINKNDGNISAPIDYIKLYSQVKYLAMSLEP